MLKFPGKFKWIGLFLITGVLIIPLIILFSRNKKQLEAKAAGVIDQAFQDKEVTYITTYPRIVLQDLWDNYKKKYIQEDGRTIDKNSDLITTSEGQSYSMLRSVWIDDKPTFDLVWKWTNINLKKREKDNLFAWKWGKKSDNDWGVLTNEQGMNTASDADQDIALALILAYHRWNDDYYLFQARKTLNDIWRYEVITINGKPYLTAGNWAAANPEKVTINPSYLSPASYEVFAAVDPLHDWIGLKSSSYEVLNQVTQKLPPDWATIDRKTGKIEPAGINEKGVVFSHDALRVPWRITLDWAWNKDQKALDYMKKLSLLRDEWVKNKSISEVYTLSGDVVTKNDNFSTYGSVLPYLQVMYPADAQSLLKEKIAPNFNPDTGDWREDLGYYDSNWVWFGLALYMNGDFRNTVNQERALTFK
jgi:endoglucanase